MSTTGNDTLIGTVNDDSLDGDAGNDSILGDAGNDQLGGGPGNDTLLGGFGNDQLYAANPNSFGWNGSSYTGFGDAPEALNVLQGEAGDDLLRGGEGQDT